jgi:hypothetical protein
MVSRWSCNRTSSDRPAFTASFLRVYTGVLAAPLGVTRPYHRSRRWILPLGLRGMASTKRYTVGRL